MIRCPYCNTKHNPWDIVKRFETFSVITNEDYGTGIIGVAWQTFCKACHTQLSEEQSIDGQEILKFDKWVKPQE